MKLKHRLPALITAAALALSVLPGIPAEAAGDDLYCESYQGTNIGSHDYSRWATTINSYLVPSGTGWMRVQGDAVPAAAEEPAKALIEYYDSAFALQSRKLVDLQLPIWGGFHAGSDGNFYLITGQANTDHDDTLPVVDIAKYSSDWKLIKHVVLKNTDLDTSHGGIDTPFEAGSLRSTDDGKWLIVNMARKMYSGHQANLTLQVSMSAMSSILNTDTGYTGYCSHAFNEFVLLDGNHIVELDHGDAYPRSIMLGYFNGDYTEGKFPTVNYTSTQTKINLVPFPAAADSSNMKEVNYTGAAVGGFVQSSTSFIAAYNSVNQEKISEYWQSYSDPYTRNIMIASVPKNDISGTITRYSITNYAEDTEKAQAPYLVPVGSDTFAVLWQRGNQVNYTTIDKTGKPSGNIKSFDGALSDCEPVVKNNKIYWYNWNNAKITFCSMNAKNPVALDTTEYVAGHDYEQLTEADENGNVTLRCSKCNTDKEIVVPTKFDVQWRLSTKPNVYFYYTPRDVDAGTTFSATGIASAPDNVTSSEYIMEVVDGGEIVTADDPESVERRQSFTVGQFDSETASCKLRIYPRYNPAAAVEYTINLKHSYEITETIQPTAEQDGSITYTCTGCGHVWKKILPKMTALDASSVKISVDDAACVYNGKEFEPKVTAYIQNADGTKTDLTENTDYLVTYESNTDAGTGIINLKALPDSR